jgi:hypothetical protein
MTDKITKTQIAKADKIFRDWWKKTGYEGHGDPLELRENWLDFYHGQYTYPAVWINESWGGYGGWIEQLDNSSEVTEKLKKIGLYYEPYSSWCLTVALI